MEVAARPGRVTFGRCAGGDGENGTAAVSPQRAARGDDRAFGRSRTNRTRTVRREPRIRVKASAAARLKFDSVCISILTPLVCPPSAPPPPPHPHAQRAGRWTAHDERSVSDLDAPLFGAEVAIKASTRGGPLVAGRQTVVSRGSTATRTRCRRSDDRHVARNLQTAARARHQPRAVRSSPSRQTSADRGGHISRRPAPRRLRSPRRFAAARLRSSRATVPKARAVGRRAQIQGPQTKAIRRWPNPTRC